MKLLFCKRPHFLPPFAASVCRWLLKVKHKTFYVFCCKNQALVVEDNMPRLYLYKHNKAWVVFYHCFFKLQTLLFSYFATSHLIVQGNRKTFLCFRNLLSIQTFYVILHLIGHRVTLCAKFQQPWKAYKLGSTFNWITLKATIHVCHWKYWHVFNVGIKILKIFCLSNEILLWYV